MPPENVFTRSSRRSHSSNIRSNTSHRSRRTWRGTWYSTPWMSMFSQAVRSLSRLGSWNTTPNRLRTSMGCVVTSSPSSSSEPVVGRKSVVSILMVVVFPAPFGPRNAKSSPARTSKETSLTAVTFPNDLTTCWTRMIGWSLKPEKSTSCLPFAPRPFLRRALLARAADYDLVPAGTLCLIHRRVGARDQLLGRIAAVGIFGEADAQREIPLAEIFCRHPGANTLGHQHGRRHVRLEQHHHELFAPVARHAVHLARRAAKDFRDLHERRVTGEVAVRVVVLLELIDVRQQHRECAAQAARALHFARQRPHEVAAVIQPGEGIGERQLLQLPVTFFLAEPRDERVERPRQVPDLAASGGGQLDGKVAGRDAGRGGGQQFQRAGDEQAHRDRHESHAQDQPEKQQHRADPQRAGLAGGRGTGSFRNGRPVLLRNPAQHRHHLTALET